VLIAKTTSEVRTSVSKNSISCFNAASRYLILILVDCRSPVHIQQEISATNPTLFQSSIKHLKIKTSKIQKKKIYKKTETCSSIGNQLTCPRRSPNSSTHHKEVKCILQKTTLPQTIHTHFPQKESNQKINKNHTTLNCAINYYYYFTLTTSCVILSKLLALEPKELTRSAKNLRKRGKEQP